MNRQNSKDQITAGFLPLLDAALLIVAREAGFADQQDIDLRLVRETSWANIRDRMAVGHFEAVHMLAPMPIAGCLGLTPLPVDVIVPMALGLGGNAVTVSRSLHDEMVGQGYGGSTAPRDAGMALARIVSARRNTDGAKLVFAVVHPHSSHNYDLRYWLVSCGVDPESDVEVVIVPPPLMNDALRSGRIDGYCVGEPWNSLAIVDDIGRVVTTKSEIWRSSPEKVLGVSARLADTQPDTVDRFVRALVGAARWCEQPENADDLATLLSRECYIGLTRDAILPALLGSVGAPYIAAGNANSPDFFIPFSRAANFPWRSHALWFYSQMVRWGHAPWSAENAMAAASCYRPDIYRRAVAPLGISLPGFNSKVEGALSQTSPVGSADGTLHLGPDGFFDGAVFDPDRLEDYVARQKRDGAAVPDV